MWCHLVVKESISGSVLPLAMFYDLPLTREEIDTHDKQEILHPTIYVVDPRAKTNVNYGYSYGQPDHKRFFYDFPLIREDMNTYDKQAILHPPIELVARAKTSG